MQVWATVAGIAVFTSGYIAVEKERLKGTEMEEKQGTRMREERKLKQAAAATQTDPPSTPIFEGSYFSRIRGTLAEESPPARTYAAAGISEALERRLTTVRGGDEYEQIYVKSEVESGYASGASSPKRLSGKAESGEKISKAQVVVMHEPGMMRR